MNDYIRMMEFFAEEGVSLSKEELKDLKDKAISISTEESSIDTIFDTILESYDADDFDDDINYLYETANGDIRKEFKQFKKDYNKQAKEYKKNIKNLNFKAANDNLSNMLAIVTKSEQIIKNINAGDTWSILSGYIMSYTVSLGRTLVLALASKALGDFTSNAINKKSGPKTVDIRTGKDMPSGGIDKGSVASFAIDVSLDLLVSIDLLAQKTHDKEKAKKNNDLNAYMNAKNDYKERVLLVFKNMKKEIIKDQLKLSKLSK